MKNKAQVTPAMLAAEVAGLGILAGMPAAIEASEKMGQVQLVRSSDMPIDLRDGKEAYEALGFTFGERIDDVFQKATLPAGWTRAATDHSMHSDILDERGRKRVSVFYKAAFYDRHAHAYLARRFDVGNYYDPDKKNAYAGAAITDNGKVTKLLPHADDNNWDSQRALVTQLTVELDAERPAWKNPIAYWAEQ
jgi:hypothetical protein